MKLALVILGMHRSGTSALARLVEHLGLSFGSGLIPADSSNPLGYYEKAEVVSIHDRALAALGLTDWSDARPLPGNWWKRPSMDRFREEIVDLLLEDFATASAFAVKDPRLCRLLPMWSEVFESLKARPVFVLIDRHPQEVCDSLVRRQGLSQRVAMALWLRHVLEAEANTRRFDRVFLGYEELLADWSTCASRIEERLGIEWPVRPSRLREPPIHRELRHHQHRDYRSCHRWLRTAHIALSNLREGEAPQILRRLSRLRGELAEMEALLVDAPSPRKRDDVRTFAAVPLWDHGQLQACTTLGEIVSGRSVEFLLRPRRSPFCGLDLLVGTYCRTNTSTLTVEIRRDSSQGPMIHRESVPAARLEDNRWCAIRFSPVWLVPDEPISVRVSSPDAEPGDAITLYTDTEGLPAYRAYRARLAPAGPVEALDHSHPAFLALLDDRLARLEAAAARQAELDLANRVTTVENAMEERLRRDGDLAARLEGYEELVDLAGRLPGLAERLDSLDNRLAETVRTFELLTTRVTALEEEAEERTRENRNLAARLEEYEEVADLASRIPAFADRLESLDVRLAEVGQTADRIDSLEVQVNSVKLLDARMEELHRQIQADFAAIRRAILDAWTPDE